VLCILVTNRNRALFLNVLSRFITPYFSENRFRILIGLLSLIVVDVVQLVIRASSMGR